MIIHEDKLTMAFLNRDAGKLLRRNLLKRNLFLRTLRRMHLIDRWMSGR